MLHFGVKWAIFLPSGPNGQIVELLLTLSDAACICVDSDREGCLGASRS